MEIKRSITLPICFFSLIIFPAIFVVTGNHSTAKLQQDDDTCVEKKCKPDGPAVRFPFILRGEHPEYCGYSPDYVLYCDPMNLTTILHLPSLSVKFEVTHIDYMSQTVQFRSPDNRFAMHLGDLNMSSTPFHFSSSLRRHSFLNCSITISNSGGVMYFPLEFCTKKYDAFGLPEIFQAESFHNLNWDVPAECKSCELHSQICKWEKETDHKVGLGCSQTQGIRNTTLQAEQ